MPPADSPGPAVDATAPARPAQKRRRSLRRWVPNQHGAWAMLVLPLGVGALRGELGWVHLWLLVAWLVAYLAYFATTVWLKSGRKTRYLLPVQVYGGVLAVAGGGLLIAEPRLLRWGVVFAPLLAASLAYSARRAERAVANDVLTIVATSLMAVIAYGLGAPDDGTWLPGAGHVPGWALAAASAAYLVGTALYVKTMIRERGNHAMYAASVVYHLAVAAVFAWWLPFVGAFLAVMAVRACLAPRHWPKARPASIGIAEIVCTVGLAAILLTLPLV